MSAPLPLGFVRLTLAHGGGSVLVPAQLFVRNANEDETLVLPFAASVVGSQNVPRHGDGIPVRETIDEIQALLVAACGAQKGDQ